MAGAGGGITLEFDGFYIDKVLNYKVNGTTVIGTATGSINITSIGTYYDGGSFEEEVPCDFDFDLEFDSAEELQAEISEYGIESVLDDFCGSSNYKAYIGGGYTHTKFTGEFDFETYSWDNVGNFSAQIKDAELISYLDRFAHGENLASNYEVFVDDEPTDEIYDTLKDAVKAAEKYADGRREVIVRKIDYCEMYNGDFDMVSDEIVWRDWEDMPYMSYGRYDYSNYDDED